MSEPLKVRRNEDISFATKYPYVIDDGEEMWYTEAELASIVAQGAALLLSGRTEGHQADGALRFTHLGTMILRTENGGMRFTSPATRAVPDLGRDEARALLFWLAKEFAKDEEAEA